MELQQNENSENTLANKQLELRVVIQHLKQREKELVAIKKAIPKAEASVSKLQSELRILGNEKRKAIEDLERIKKEIMVVLKDKNNQQDQLKFELRQHQLEITSRKKFLTEQEELISQTLEHGNEKLRILQYEVEELDRNKQELENDIYKSQQIQEQIGRDITNVSTELGVLQSAAREEREHLGNILENTKKQIKEAKLELERISIETAKKLKILKGKEESIIARENAIRLKTDELGLRERRLDSAEHLYS